MGSSLVLTSQPLAGRQLQELAESCFPHKSALGLVETLDILSPSFRNSVVQDFLSVAPPHTFLQTRCPCSLHSE